MTDLYPGGHVRLRENMGIDGCRDGIIASVNGGDIYVKVNVRGIVVEAHRYANEMEVVCMDHETIIAAALKDQRDKVCLDQHVSNCPAERLIADALDAAGIPYQHESHPARAREKLIQGARVLDFKLDDHIYIEVKLMHTPRVEQQLATADNIILVQGMKSARWLAELIAKGNLK